jgi:hypothetical protein
MLYHLTPISSNVKTGPIAVSTTSRDSCPKTCPFMGSGCYAEAGPMVMHWNTLDTPKGQERPNSSKKGRGVDLDTFTAQLRTLPRRSSFRHNQAGDLAHTDGLINTEHVFSITAACKARNLNAFTYTHHDTGHKWNRDAIATMNASGFTVNLSTETLEGADKAAALNIGPVCVTLTEDQAPEGTKTLQTPAGRPVTVCPAQTVDGMTCAQCMLCAKVDRRAIVGFIVHGTGKAKARKVINLKAG